MQELHEVNLKTFEDSIVKTGGSGHIKKYLSEYEALNPENYYYTVPIYNFKVEDYCEICGQNFKELKNIDTNNEISWTALTYVKRYICTNCAKPLIPKIRMESSKDHRKECCCHSCIVAHELGYYKKNNEWIMRTTMKCNSLMDGCKTCYHAAEHIQNEYCNCNFIEKGCNRTEGCIEVKNA